jgi:4-hydroxybenzoate polyprenyltransferase
MLPFKAFWQLMRADKPIGIYLLLWPTLWSLLIASEGTPPLSILFIFIAGVVVMRSAGCVINDIADRKIDGAVKRTAQRPLATGAATVKQALGLFFFLLLIALLLVLNLNTQTILLSFGGVLLASIYPFMKRYTHLPQVVLGAAFSWSIPMAAMAILETLPIWVWWLYFGNLVWTVAYDTQYAMVDRDDDLLVGVKSTAILFGQYDRFAIFCLQIATILTLAVVGWMQSLGVFYYVALGITSVLFLQQQFSIRERQREACFKAFLDNHYVGMVIAVGIALSYWI